MFARMVGLFLISATFALLCLSAPADAIEPQAPPGEPATAFPSPDRPVASIVSPVWASEDERRSVEETTQVFQLMQIRPGMSVADIGAGSGYYTVQLSDFVGPEGKVYPQDVRLDYLIELKKRIADLKLKNVEIGLGEGHDPRLPRQSIDVALLVHMYHEIEQPYALLYNLSSSLKPNARVGIVDLDRSILQHGTPPALLQCELESVGYRQTGFHTLSGGVGYLAIFAAPEAATRPSSIRRCKSNGK